MEHDIAKMPGIIHFSLSTENGNNIMMPYLLWPRSLFTLPSGNFWKPEARLYLQDGPFRHGRVVTPSSVRFENPGGRAAAALPNKLVRERKRELLKVRQPVEGTGSSSYQMR